MTVIAANHTRGGTSVDLFITLARTYILSISIQECVQIADPTADGKNEAGVLYGRGRGHGATVRQA